MSKALLLLQELKVIMLNHYQVIPQLIFIYNWFHGLVDGSKLLRCLHFLVPVIRT